MKRALVAILALSYLCLSIGITVHVHYCMGKMVGMSLLEQQDEHNCKHCGMSKKSSKNDCCKDEHKIIKKSSDQVIVKDFITQIQYLGEAVAIQSYTFSTARIPIYYSNRMAQAHAPPLIGQSCPIYLRLQNFRI